MGDLSIIKVQYTVIQSYVEENKAKIAAVMKELRALSNPDVKYSAYLLDDGKSFMHIVVYNGPNTEDLPSSLDSFKQFQISLKDNLEIPPKVEEFSLVDSSFDF